MEVSNAEITLYICKNEFLEKYFPANDHSKKEIKFLQLKKGGMIVANYTTIFEEFLRFCPHYNGLEDDGLKCVKFESGLCLEIKQLIGYQEINQFLVLVNKCRIYDEDSRAISAHYKSDTDKKSESRYYGKPYVTSVDKGK
ncbi:uncharacterized protein LOC127131432 [Lathyrus oleraceus]|uniref:uncharacterized protein LOC127131432 n=1 Tax=Pisum sativum TaxID=3888 RepID=UPI0021D00211|nr:uncharacterized protein LOC127131432 [Pisum sativum]